MYNGIPIENSPAMIEFQYEFTCPNGFAILESKGRKLGCYQKTQQGSLGSHAAVLDCWSNYGGRLPSITEQYLSHSNGSGQSATELTDQSDYWSQAGQGYANPALNTASTTGYGNTHAYRCFIPAHGHFESFTCQPGFSLLTNHEHPLGCMQNIAQGSLALFPATDDCWTTHGGRLPSFSELAIGYQEIAWSSPTSELIDQSDYWTQQGAAHFNPSTAASTHALASPYSYRCFIPTYHSPIDTPPPGFTALTSQGYELGFLQTNIEATLQMNIGALQCFTKYGGRLPSIGELEIGHLEGTSSEGSESIDQSDYATVSGHGFADPSLNTASTATFSTPLRFRCFLPRH